MQSLHPRETPQERPLETYSRLLEVITGQSAEMVHRIVVRFAHWCKFLPGPFIVRVFVVE